MRLNHVFLEFAILVACAGYDYDSENGRGVVMLIHAGYSRQQSGSADDMSTQVKYGDVFSASGGYDTDDATKVDAIIVAEMENVGSWAPTFLVYFLMESAKRSWA